MFADRLCGLEWWKPELELGSGCFAGKEQRLQSTDLYVALGREDGQAQVLYWFAIC